MDVISAAILIGLTFYGGDFYGETMACGDTMHKSGEIWAALPLEWRDEGRVSCGDIVFAVFPDGTLVAAEVKDFGCHLHWPAWDTGSPYGGDFPRHGALASAPTGTGKMMVWRSELGQWWNPPTDLAVFESEWCKGPLSMALPKPEPGPGYRKGSRRNRPYADRTGPQK